MKLKLNTDADVNAAALVAGLQSYRSISMVIMHYSSINDTEENFSVTIRKSLLPVSFRSNPSAFALKCLDPSYFQSCAGYQTPGKPKHITIKLYRGEKPYVRIQPRPSVKRIIIDWLNLNLPRTKSLEIPTESIPPFLFSHPEQLTYQINREIQIPIKITRNLETWNITRK